MYIKKNPKVIVPGFLIVIREGFSKNGIPTKVYKEGDIPKDCHYIMTYTALRSWDFVPYLSHAELHIESDGHIIAYGKYHLIGKGGLSFYKWASVRSKMNPVIDKMLNKSQ